MRDTPSPSYATATKTVSIVWCGVMISAVPFSITFATPVGSQLVNGSSAQLCATADYEEAMALADRILVLHDGAVEQIGTPEEVYRRPATTFTAAITGSPPMNLIPCTVRDGVAAAGNLAFRVSGMQGEAVVGVRPEEVRIGAGPEGVVDLVQPLGRKKIVDVILGGVRIKAVTGPEFVASRGTRLSLEVDPAAIRVYDDEGRLSEARASGSWVLLG